ncbi:MAG: hypothetical protein KJ559_02480, partial [Nanoarchaeota archaeon]|nr:hypothetical protein [Nanoarchaeota archaeon]
STIHNTSTDDGEFYSAGVSITSLADGIFTYNFSCMADNGTDQEWSVGYANITILNTPAHIDVNNFTIFNATLNAMSAYGNYSGNMTMNATVNISVVNVLENGSSIGMLADAGMIYSFLDSVYYNLSLDGVQLLFWNSISDIANSLPFNESVDTFNGSFADDYQGYKLCIYANDTLGNINHTECYSTLSIDNNAPSVTLTQDAVKTTTDSITFSISPGETGSGMNGDCTTSKGTISALSVTSPGLLCGTSYSYVVSCTDYMGFVGSKTESFSTDACIGGVATSSGGSSTTASKTYVISEIQLKEGYTKQIKQNEQIRFSVGTSKHTVQATSISADTVTITISSTPQTATLQIGDERKFDLDDDGVYDAVVKLNGIVSGKADLTVKEITEKVTDEAIAKEADKEKAAAGEKTIDEEEKIKAGSLMWLWILIVVVLVAVIAYVVYKKQQ